MTRIDARSAVGRGRPTGVVLALLVLACARPAVSTPEITVELDVYSGRPNPSWTLTSAESAEVLRRLRGLPRAANAVLPDVGLGYRGFVVTGGGAELRGGAARVASGLVSLGDGEEADVYRDVHGLESFLIERARGRGYGGALPAP